MPDRRNELRLIARLANDERYVRRDVVNGWRRRHGGW